MTLDKGQWLNLLKEKVGELQRCLSEQPVKKIGVSVAMEAARMIELIETGKQSGLFEHTIYIPCSQTHKTDNPGPIVQSNS